MLVVDMLIDFIIDNDLLKFIDRCSRCNNKKYIAKKDV
jgi:hypothetical protein